MKFRLFRELNLTTISKQEKCVLHSRINQRLVRNSLKADLVIVFFRITMKLIVVIHLFSIRPIFYGPKNQDDFVDCSVKIHAIPL